MEEGGWDVMVGKVVVHVRRGSWGVSEDVLRERNLLQTTEMGYLLSFFEC